MLARRLLVLPSLAVVAVVAGCGGSSSSSTDTTKSTASTKTGATTSKKTAKKGAPAKGKKSSAPTNASCTAKHADLPEPLKRLKAGDSLQVKLSRGGRDLDATVRPLRATSSKSVVAKGQRVTTKRGRFVTVRFSVKANSGDPLLVFQLAKLLDFSRDGRGYSWDSKCPASGVYAKKVGIDGPGDTITVGSTKTVALSYVVAAGGKQLTVVSRVTKDSVPVRLPKS
jgi:hypothetical protein